MGIQFLLSLIGGAVAGAGLVLILGKYAYKWYKKEQLILTGEMVAIVSILIVTGTVSAYTLGEASYHIAKDGVHSVLHTYHDYQKNWASDTIKPVEKTD